MLRGLLQCIFRSIMTPGLQTNSRNEFLIQRLVVIIGDCVLLVTSTKESHPALLVAMWCWRWRIQLIHGENSLLLVFVFVDLFTHSLMNCVDTWGMCGDKSGQGPHTWACVTHSMTSTCPWPKVSAFAACTKLQQPTLSIWAQTSQLTRVLLLPWRAGIITCISFTRTCFYTTAFVKPAVAMMNHWHQLMPCCCISNCGPVTHKLRCSWWLWLA